MAPLKDTAVAPLPGPVVDVVAAAKTDFATGDILDGTGGFCMYRLCENHETATSANGIAEGTRLRRLVAEDCLLFLDYVNLT